uniref:Uncharacterized protein n=1 Tax=Sphaerodactylus townsendi TaxID=933632 RepID=A0ACB8EXD4_9SAUR
MRSPQFCCLLLAVSLMPGTPLLAGARELQDPESQDLSGHLFLQEMLGLGHPHQDTPNRSLRSTIPWQPPPPPRPRKAGCKNFYWKTLTSC